MLVLGVSGGRQSSATAGPSVLLDMGGFVQVVCIASYRFSALSVPNITSQVNIPSSPCLAPSQTPTPKPPRKTLSSTRRASHPATSTSGSPTKSSKPTSPPSTSGPSSPPSRAGNPTTTTARRSNPPRPPAPRCSRAISSSSPHSACHSYRVVLRSVSSRWPGEGWVDWRGGAG